MHHTTPDPVAFPRVHDRNNRLVKNNGHENLNVDARLAGADCLRACFADRF